MADSPARAITPDPPAPDVWTWGALVPGDTIVLNGARDQVAQEAWEVEDIGPWDGRHGWVRITVGKYRGVELQERATYQAVATAEVAETWPDRPVFVEPSPYRRPAQAGIQP